MRFVLTFPFPSDQLPNITSSLAAFPVNAIHLAKFYPSISQVFALSSSKSSLVQAVTRRVFLTVFCPPWADWGLNPRSGTLAYTPSHQEIHWQKIASENESPCDTFHKFFSLHLCSWKWISCSWMLLNPVKFVSFLLPVCKNRSVFCKTSVYNVTAAKAT